METEGVGMYESESFSLLLLAVLGGAVPPPLHSAPRAGWLS